MPIIENSGSTALEDIGSSYSIIFAPSLTATLTYGGSAVTPGQFGPWTPWSAELRATVDVVWKNTATNQFIVWNVSDNGNYLGQSAPMSGTSLALESLETSFSHDLNGDGTIGVVMTTIESVGVTTLAEVAGTYALFASGTTTGPQLMRGGNVVTVGQYGAWTPIAAEKTTYGYEVAWKNDSTGQSLVWATDANGNYLSDMVAPVSSGSDAFKAFEGSFGQDLNGDGSFGGAT